MEWLAEKWETRIDDAYYAFNDVNAMMALSAPATATRSSGRSKP